MSIKYIVSKIKAAQHRVEQADNNLRYIKSLTSLCFWLDKLYTKLYIEKDHVSERKKYEDLVGLEPVTLTLYDRAFDSLISYEHGFKPF